jgi:hypothetical protein
MSFFGSLRRSLFGLGEKDIAACCMHWQDANPVVRERLDSIVDSFAVGYNLALSCAGVPELIEGLERHVPERKGFAYEGAGMGLAIRIMITPGSKLLAEYLRGPGDPHHYMIQVGAGWALGRVPVRHAALRRQLDDTFHWLAWDGYGFHQVFFDTKRTCDEHAGRPADKPYQGRAFDQGVGRAMWFVEMADPARIANKFSKFSIARQHDLWGGVGLAASYAGGVEAAVLDDLIERSGEYRPALGAGSMLAATARERAGNPSPHSLPNCVRMTGLSESVVREVIHTATTTCGTGDLAFPNLRALMEERVRAGR